MADIVRREFTRTEQVYKLTCCTKAVTYTDLDETPFRLFNPEATYVPPREP